MPRTDKAAIAAQIAALQAQLEGDESGVYEDPATGRWYVKFRVAGKQTTRRSAPDGSPLLNRDQALIARGLWEAANERAEVTVGRMRFEQAWERYLRHAKAEMSAGSFEQVVIHGRKRLLPHFASAQVSSLTVPVIRDWRATMLEEVEAGDFGPKTVNNARQVLMAFCHMAVEENLLPFNPVASVKPLRIERLERPYLRIGQIGDYLDACAPFYRPLAQFLIGTGARVSEAIAVLVEDLSFITRDVRISKQLDAATMKPRPTKGRNFRSVAMGPGLAEALQDSLAVRAELGLDDAGWMFLVPPSKRGRYAGRTEPRPPHRKTVHDWHERALRDAGLPDMPLHALRHTAAAAWLGTGRNLEFVRAQLGHSSSKVTSDYYGHLEDQFRTAGAADTEARIRDARQARVLVA